MMPSPDPKTTITAGDVFAEALSKAVIIIPSKGDDATAAGAESKDERMKVDEQDPAEPDSNEGTEGKHLISPHIFYIEVTRSIILITTFILLKCC